MAPASGTGVLAFTSATPSIVGTLTQSAAGTSVIVLGNATGIGSATVLTLGGNGVSSTFNGTISDLSAVNAASTGSLVQVGNGILILGGANTYTGGTTVSGGTIVLGSTALGSGGITIGSGATANFAGYSPANNVTINGGTLYLGPGGATGTIALANSANTIDVSGYYQVLSGQIADPQITLGGDSTPGLALSNLRAITFKAMLRSTPAFPGTGWQQCHSQHRFGPA